MKAYKCDRCGNFFETKIEYVEIINKGLPKTALARIELNKIRFADLCEKCANSFAEWWKEGAE